MLQLYWLISALIDVGIVLKFNLVDSIWDIIPAILLHVLILALMCGLHLLLVILYSFTADCKKEVTNIHNSYRWILLYSLKLYFQLAQVKIQATGLDKIPEDDKFLFVGNHISSYDPMVAMWTLRKKNLAFVSKKENLEIGVDVLLDGIIDAVYIGVGSIHHQNGKVGQILFRCFNVAAVGKVPCALLTAHSHTLGNDNRHPYSVKLPHKRQKHDGGNLEYHGSQEGYQC